MGRGSGGRGGPRSSAGSASLRGGNGGGGGGNGGGGGGSVAPSEHGGGEVTLVTLGSSAFTLCLFTLLADIRCALLPCPLRLSFATCVWCDTGSSITAGSRWRGVKGRRTNKSGHCASSLWCVARRRQYMLQQGVSVAGGGSQPGAAAAAVEVHLPAGLPARFVLRVQRPRPRDALQATHIRTTLAAWAQANGCAAVPPS